MKSEYSMGLFKKIILLIFSLFYLSNLVFSQESQTYKVLLLNSYHKGYLWTDEITRGIESTLSDFADIELHIEYMDTKRQFDDEYLDLLAMILAKKHSMSSYDVIITSDDNAFNFILDKRFTVFQNVPIVFSGLNYYKKENYGDLTDITGINEKANLSANIELITKLHGNIKNILVLTDDTTTGQRIQEEVRLLQSQRERGSIAVDLLYDVSINELKQSLSQLTGDTVVLYTFFFRDSEGVFLEYQKSTQLVCKSSPVPVYGSWQFSLGYGIVGGYLTDGYDQGVIAAEKALSIIQGWPAEEIPITDQTPSNLLFDYYQLEKHSLSLKNLEDEYEILYKPYSLYQENKLLIWQTFALFTLLLLFSVFISFSFIRSRRSESYIRKSREKLRIILNSIGDAIFVTDLEGNLDEMNPAAETLTGYSFEESKGQSLSCILSFIAEKEDDSPRNSVQTVLETGNHVSHEGFFLFESRDKSIHRVIDSASPIHDGEGHINGVVLVLRDMTNEFEMIESLRENQKQFQSIVSNILGVTYRCRYDSTWSVVYISPYIEKISGFSPSDFISNPARNLSSIIYSKDLLTVLKKVKQAITDEESWDIEYRIVDKDGNRHWISEKGSAIKSEDGQVRFLDGILLDITEKIKIEEMMIQSEKMLSVGGLAAGMAHEINNPLGGIIQSASVLSKRLSDFELPGNIQAATESGLSFTVLQDYLNKRKIFNMLDRIQESGKRAAEIISNMLSFARKGNDARSSIDLSLLLDQCIDLASLDYNLKKNYDFRKIGIHREYDKDVKPVPCDSSKIQQVFMNILRNGAEIMNEDSSKQSHFYLRIKRDERAQMVVIEIEDNGPGMTDEVKKRIFEPFFTTKSSDGGTGLGLSVSYFIITQIHKGILTVESEPGRGSTFIIGLPLSSSTD
jgi:PAS domain S-box-containing protein